MNAYQRGISVLLAIAATLVALFSYRFLPEKRYLATSDPAAEIYLYSTQLPDGEWLSSWLNKNENYFRCTYPENMPDYSYYCSYNLGFGFSPKTAKNLSQYRTINLSLEYHGNAPKMRFFARNYNPAYSVPDDFNSSKYNAIFLATKDLKGEVQLDISEFVVSEWWLMGLKINRENSFPELDKVVNFGLDFSDSMTVGNHDIKVNKIEFVGEWVSREHWYLGIMCLWMLWFFINTIRKLTLLSLQRQEHENVIQRLHEHNRNLAQEKNRFRRLSTVDALTDTYNRFGIEQIVHALLGEEDPQTFAIILFDIDLFKRINDHRGHDAGDKVLEAVADIITRNARIGDKVGRWGGEEFIVILPYTSHEFALALAEKIRISVHAHTFDKDHPLIVTLSAGISAVIPGEAFADTFKRADEALYEAKGAGRNCCIVAKPHVTEYLSFPHG